MRLFATVAVAALSAACNEQVTLGSRAAHSDGAAHFATLPPQSALPSGAECARRVGRSGFEPRPENTGANHTTPAPAVLESVHATSWVAVDDRASSDVRARIDGDYTGTTDEIIEWAACKWGFDDNFLRAVAVVSSDWRQSASGGVYAGTCPPDLAPVDGGDCPHLFGLFAVNYDAEESAHSTWPALRDSTAFNADFMGGFLRMCFEGYVSWLDSPQVTPENGGPYVAGDEWSCLGFAASGRWQNADANAFTDTVRAAYRDEPWLDEGF